MSKVIKNMLEIGSKKVQCVAKGKNHRIVNRGKVSFMYYKDIKVATLLKNKDGNILILSNKGIVDGWLKKRMRAYCYEANKLGFTVIDLELIENPLQDAEILVETIRDENYKKVKQDVIVPTPFKVRSKVLPELEYIESDYRTEVC